MAAHLAGWTAIGRFDQAARVILPAFKHETHTLTRFGVPPTMARTRWMFGTQRRFVRMCEWEIEWP